MMVVNFTFTIFGLEENELFKKKLAGENLLWLILYISFIIISLKHPGLWVKLSSGENLPAATYNEMQ